jgi:hypothetical protein
MISEVQKAMSFVISFSLLYSVGFDGSINKLQSVRIFFNIWYSACLIAVVLMAFVAILRLKACLFLSTADIDMLVLKNCFYTVYHLAFCVLACVPYILWRAVEEFTTIRLGPYRTMGPSVPLANALEKDTYGTSSYHAFGVVCRSKGVDYCGHIGKSNTNP